MEKASRPDNINNIILKELSNQLAKPLCNLFNSSLLTGKVKSQWKLAILCAVFESKKAMMALIRSPDLFHVTYNAKQN